MATAIHWFRQDLRLSDNPALVRAAGHDRVIPVYILDDANAGDHAPGAAGRCWLHHALNALNWSLGGRLSVYRGNPQTVLDGIIARHGVETVCWNRCYEPWQMARDKKIKAHLRENGIAVHSCNASLLWEPWEITKENGEPYRVFTPFYRKGCLGAAPPRRPLPTPDGARYLHDGDHASAINALDLLPKIRWDTQLEGHWVIGEAGAQAQCKRFVDHGLADYRKGRDYPARPHVSRLSPHLHFGEISPHQLWHTMRTLGDDDNIDHFCSELGWREFAHSLLYFNPQLPEKNLQTGFDHFPWADDPVALAAWQKGETGIPMVDAGMRELWQTGYMHNRVRMIVGSFLVKNLRLHWHHGARWFFDTLVDADLANNSAGWQWIAGCGADAAPYFRIFNPVLQGKKFDPDGDYIRRFVPEIAALPGDHVFCPWEAPPAVLAAAGVRLGTSFPLPIVDLKQSRQQALAAFKAMNAKARPEGRPAA